MKILKSYIFIIFSLSLSLLAKDVATITAINGEAFIQRDNTKVAITLGITLQEKDTIITNKAAKVQVIFSDETIITIGKNSKFSISEYLFEDQEEPVAKFSMLKGAMRTITGKIGKIAPDKFKVTAKTATIGIRGTNFSVVVGENDVTEVYCTFGAISTTINGTEHIVNQGFFIAISPDGNTEIKEFKAKDLENVNSNFSKSTAKEGDVNDDTTSTNNTSIIDTTTEDLDNIIIKDISDTTTDAEQTSVLDGSLSDLLAGYSMSNALYTGTYNTNSSSPQVSSSGTAELNVDFGKDEINLTIKNIDPQSSTDAVYSSTSQISGVNFTASYSNSSLGTVDNASGTFKGDTGNNATGTFNYTYDGGTEAGTFDVTSSQTLN